jgi:hypothetical protein
MPGQAGNNISVGKRADQERGGTNMTLAGIEALIKVTQQRVASLRSKGDHAGASQASQTLSSLFEQRNTLRQAA